MKFECDFSNVKFPEIFAKLAENPIKDMISHENSLFPIYEPDNDFELHLVFSIEKGHENDMYDHGITVYDVVHLFTEFLTQGIIKMKIESPKDESD